MTIQDPSIATDNQAASVETEAADVAPAPETEAAEAGAGDEKPEVKPEKTPEQREIERLRRGIDRRTRQLSDARAQLDLTRSQKQDQNQQTADDSEPLSLTRAQIAEMVKAEAQKLAPTLSEQAAETERRQGVVQSLAKTWGQEKFDEVSSELDDVFGGLTDRSGKPKAATEAIFEADEPAKVIEWLIDPENADEAERISRLGAVQAGKAIAKLEAKLSTEKPKPPTKISKAPPPLEAVRGAGSTSAAPDPSNTKAWIKWRNEQERLGR